MKIEETPKNARLERELERERQQRHRNDEARAGIFSDDDLRLKDARESNSSGHLHRHGGR
ncbi:MAG TPA: hypothetical protein VGC21_25380 [Telluria sp.]|jgi:hypothetical protein